MIRRRPLATLLIALICVVCGYPLLFFFGCVILFFWGREYKRLFFPRQVDKSRHLYQESSELRYDGDLPILAINATDPEARGRELGKHTGKQFIDLWYGYIQFLPYAMRYITGNYIDDPLTFIKSEIKRLELQFPESLLAEMKGYLSQVNFLALDDFKALFCFADIYKGMGGCGAAVRPFELIRNLDWYSMGVLGDTTLLTFYPVSTAKPKKVMSITFPPCLLGLSMANDTGFVATLNEVTKMKTKRNHKGGYPEFLLLRELVHNCSTVEEAIAFIAAHPPASSHILALMDKSGDGAIIQLLPTGSDELFTVRRLKDTYVHATNHFVDEDGEMIPGTEAIASSLPRFTSMENALKEQKGGREVLAAGNCYVTMHSMIFTHQDGEFILQLNYDNFQAGKITNVFKTINLTKLFN